MRIHITDELLARARPAPHKPQAYLFDTELPTFGVVLGKTSQMFIVQFRDHTGRKRRYALGHRSPTFGVAAARAKARAEIEARRASPRTRERTAKQRLEHAFRAYFRELIVAEIRRHQIEDEA
jgi:hypothetical protein